MFLQVDAQAFDLTRLVFIAATRVLHTASSGSALRSGRRNCFCPHGALPYGKKTARHASWRAAVVAAARSGRLTNQKRQAVSAAGRSVYGTAPRGT